VSWNRILSHAFDHTYADNGQSLVLRLKRLYAGQVARYSLDHLRLISLQPMARRYDTVPSLKTVPLDSQGC